MNRFEYYCAALKARTYIYRHWVITLFSANIFEEENAWKKNPYDYRLVRTKDKVYYVDPVTKELAEIVNAKPDRQLIYPDVVINAPAGTLPNIHEDIETTAGDLFFNAFVLTNAFGGLFPFTKGPIDPVKLEKMISKVHVDEPPPGVPVEEGKIPNSQFLTFNEAMNMLPTYNSLWVPSASPKSLTTDPAVAVRRKELEEINKGKLDDPAVVAGMAKELIQIDKDWVDDEGKEFLIANKAWEQSRKKQFIMIGYEKPFVDGEPSHYIGEPLTSGLDPKNMPVLANSSREGSIDRGIETAKGGVVAKEALRNTQNIEFISTNCGDTHGLVTLVLSENKDELLNTYYIASPLLNNVRIDESNFDSLIGKTLRLRSPGYCKQSETDFCTVCMGDGLSMYPEAAGAMSASFGSTFMQASMKKMHSTALQLVELDIDECLC